MIFIEIIILFWFLFHILQTSLTRRNGAMSMNQRSHSAAPSENYRSTSLQRRGSLSPPEDLYQDYLFNGK